MQNNDHNPTLSGAEVQPAIALLETASVAAGIEMTDAILWESDIELLFATPVQPGKYVVLFRGASRPCAAPCGEAPRSPAGISSTSS